MLLPFAGLVYLDGTDYISYSLICHFIRRLRGLKRSGEIILGLQSIESMMMFYVIVIYIQGT